MSVESQVSQKNEQTPAHEEKIIDRSQAKINYILYLLGLVTGITGIVGVVFAYTKRGDDNPEWLNSHYTYQIRTFWYGFIYLMIAILLAVVVIGNFIALWWLVWLIIRCVKGMDALDKGQEIPNPKAFFGFGFR